MKTEKVSEFIVDWLKNYAQTNKISGFVVGISGGIDSAVTSTLCAKTGLEVICVEMPIKQNDEHVSRAKNHIKNLQLNYDNVTGKLVDLNSVFDSFCKEVNSSKKNSTHELSLANTRARLRMTTLYYFAGINNYLVAGTGNKVEDFGVGFYTKYGDGGVDISPIADCTKTQVWELGKYLGVDNKIINAEPTDGLWNDARTDVDQLGMSYQDLEKAMNNSNDPNYKKYLEIRKRNLHKMNPIPVCKFND